MLPKLARENLLELCRRMFVIRHFEESLVPLHDQGVFGGHYRYRLMPSSEGWRIRAKEVYLMNCWDYHSNLGLPF